MSLPNIIYILADDLGYGDVLGNNPKSRIPTPRLEELAARGMRFTDAHATSAVCSPSRYSILTGRYAWRTRLKRGIVWPWDGSLIEPDVPTVATMLSEHGYRTACVGKWHLGWNWPTKDGSSPNDTLPYGVYCDDERSEYERNIDYRRPIRGGPVDHGFDSYFGVDVPNFTPYTWFADDQVVEAPTQPKPDSLYGHPGQMVPGWRHEAVVPACTRHAVELIEASAESDSEPLFLFFALTSPHSPVAPNERHRGQSGIGNYGDFVCELDWAVGEIIDAVDRSSMSEDTLIIFTSDNGPETETADDEGAYSRARRSGHYSMGPLRGVKRDVWEGGHRVPFIASWPAVIPPGTCCDHLISLADFFSTCASIVDSRIQPNAAQDSQSILPLLNGERSSEPVRSEMVLHSGGGRFAFREGPWLLIDGPSGSEKPEPDWLRAERGYKSHHEAQELYDLSSDLSERDNLIRRRPTLGESMSRQLNATVGHHRRRPDPEDTPITE